MNTLDPHLKFEYCPHCSQHNPNLTQQHTFSSNSDTNDDPTLWGVYTCKRCGWATLALADPTTKLIKEYFPDIASAHIALPETVKDFLDQAIQTVNSPAASIMMSNSAIDAMLKAKNYNDKDQKLYTRIEAAGKDHLLTPDMVTWAHQVRLDANDQRHSDETAPKPTLSDAKKCLEFAKTLGEILFVIPEKVTRNITNAPPIKSTKNKNIPELRKIKFPPAYRNRPYSHFVVLDKSDDKPVVTARIRPALGSTLLPVNELEVVNKDGYTNRWLAIFKIENPSKFPELSKVEIIVDGVVAQVGELRVNLDVT